MKCRSRAVPNVSIIGLRAPNSRFERRVALALGKAERVDADQARMALLKPWGDVELLGRASGGARNDVWRGSVRGAEVFVRFSSRDPEAVSWELDVLDIVREVGLGAPELVATADGQRMVNGVVVFQGVEGRRPASGADWMAVARYLATLHAETAGWMQRPGFAATSDLLDAERGGDVDLRAMPSAAVEQCRTAWARIATYPMSAIHGDPGLDNIFITAEGPVLIDWDESRVDVPVFDLAALPAEFCPIRGHDRWVAEQAASAWEAAVSWKLEPGYARRRLAELSIPRS